jgi:hypothetical protein
MLVHDWPWRWLAKPGRFFNLKPSSWFIGSLESGIHRPSWFESQWPYLISQAPILNGFAFETKFVQKATIQE